MCKNRKIVTIVMHKSYYAIIMRRRASGMNSNLKKGKKRKHIRKGGKNIYIYTMKEKSLRLSHIPEIQRNTHRGTPSRNYTRIAISREYKEREKL